MNRRACAAMVADSGEPRRQILWSNHATVQDGVLFRFVAIVEALGIGHGGLSRPGLARAIAQGQVNCVLAVHRGVGELIPAYFRDEYKGGCFRC